MSNLHKLAFRKVDKLSINKMSGPEIVGYDLNVMCSAFGQNG